MPYRGGSPPLRLVTRLSGNLTAWPGMGCFLLPSPLAPLDTPDQAARELSSHTCHAPHPLPTVPACACVHAESGLVILVDVLSCASHPPEVPCPPEAHSNGACYRITPSRSPPPFFGLESLRHFIIILDGSQWQHTDSQDTKHTTIQIEAPIETSSCFSRLAFCSALHPLPFACQSVSRWTSFLHPFFFQCGKEGAFCCMYACLVCGEPSS